ncbi:hypothetical protein LguiB_035854 [Lonicera macranthoides]
MKGALLLKLSPLRFAFSQVPLWVVVSLHAIPQKPSTKPSLQTFMVVAKKDSSIVMHQVSSSFTRSTIDCSGDQVEI